MSSEGRHGDSADRRAVSSVSVRPLCEDDRQDVGELLVAAFPDKLAAMLAAVPSPAVLEEKGRALMRDLTLVTMPPSVWVAADDEGLAGVVIVKDSVQERPALSPWGLLRRRLGLRAALRARLFLLVFHAVRVPHDTLYVEMLAAHPRRQGTGVGGVLLRHVTAEARRRGKRFVLLYCIDRNERALSFYRHLGFVVLRHEQLWPFRGLLGFDSTFRMQLDLDRDGSPPAEGPGDASVGVS